MAIGRVESLELDGKRLTVIDDGGNKQTFYALSETEYELLVILFGKLKRDELGMGLGDYIALAQWHGLLEDLK